MRNERWEMGIPRKEWRMLIGWMMGRKGGEVEVKVEVKMDSAVCSRRMHGGDWGGVGFWHLPSLAEDRRFEEGLECR